MRPLPDADALREVLKPLFDRSDVRLVVLFGSLASGKTHSESDVDLGIECAEPFDPVDMTNAVIDLLHDDRVDVIDLRRADPLLASEASKGLPLFERPPGRFREFACLAWKRRLDYEPYMEIERRWIREAREALPRR